MLVSFSTQSARAKRKNVGLLLLGVSVLEQAAAAVRAAETQGQGIVLIVNATAPLLYSLDVFVSSLLTLGRLSKNSVTVGVYCGPTHVAAQQAIESGAQVIIPEQQHSREQFATLLSWSANYAYSQGAEIVLGPAIDESLPALFAEMDTVPLAGLLLSATALDQAPEGLQSVSKAIQHLTRLPIFVECSTSHTPAELRRYRKAGLAGILLSEDIDEAFTAGVRTALRDRELGNPTTYLNKGGVAVEHKVVSYLHVLC